MRLRAPKWVDSKQLLSKLSSEEVTRFGVRLLHDTHTGLWRLKDIGGGETYSTKREALLSYFSSYGRTYGSLTSPYTLKRHTIMSYDSQTTRWRLFNKGGTEVARWLVRPNRQELAHTLRALRVSDSRPSFRRPDTLGWRTFAWHPTKHCIISPVRKTLWLTPELRVENWSDIGAVRDHAGIHACRLPRGDWRNAQRPADMPPQPIVALVERFGKFVLGSTGWRAEWIFIKELMAPDEATARALRRVYPELPICVAKHDHWSRSC